MMQILLWYILPISLIAATFGLRPLRSWLEHCAKESVNQAEMVEAYQDNVAEFLRLSDPEKHSEMREIAVWAGHRMLDGTKLIRMIIFTRIKRGVSDDDIHASIEESVSSLSEAAQHAFARALASALIVSSYQSFFYGHRYRSMLRWAFKSDREVKDPEQIVYRYRTTRTHRVGPEQLA